MLLITAMYKGTRDLLASSGGSRWILLCITLLLVLVFLRRVLQKFSKLPPGPWGLPFLGFLPYLTGVPHEQFYEMSKKYGSIFSTRLGSHLVVVLADYKSIRSAFRKEAFSGRPDNEITALMDGFGVINIDGDLWKDQRRFLHERMRHFGMKHMGNGKENLEARITIEVKSFLQSLVKAKGKPRSINSALGLSVGNVICSMLMSVRFTLEDPVFKRFNVLIEEGFKLVCATGAANFIPCMRNLPKIQELNVKIKSNRAEMVEFYKDIVQKHKETFDPENIRDLVDTYLHEIELAKKEGREEYLFGGKDPDRQIYQIMGDLYSAGTDTIKSTLQWGVVYMLHHPEIMKNVQQELDQVVGRNRLPTLEDLPYLQYTEATILEVLRRSTVVPMGTTHGTTKDVELDGFKIPQHTQVIPLIHAVHSDPELWDEPNKFNPSRFLNAEGRVVKPEFFMPFGVGRRMCLGDVLARMELFLFFSSLLHVFHLELPEGEILPSVQGQTPGVTTTPEQYKVCAIPRQTEFTTCIEGLTDSLSTRSSEQLSL